LAEDVTHAERWNEAFRNQTDGWEQGMPSPVLAARKAAVAKVVSPGAKLLVPGCGRGHDAELLATWGYQVTALDFSVEAEREFRRLYPDSKVTFIRGDVFEFLKAHAKTFQAIFEHTIFCAIDPLRRPDYLSAAHQSLVESGHWLGVFFMLDHEGGPPFGMTQWELREMTKSKFAARTWEFAAESTEKRRFQELWCVFQRR
jgi:SAM-dependent methyltransferase